jgi:hypothetical protein
MAEQRSDDLLRARRESAELIGLDVEYLSPADTLRCDMISALRIVIDSEQANVVDGGRADLGRLVVATEQLIKLLPERQLAAPESQRDDPRQAMWEIYKTMRERGEIDLRPDEGWYQARINALEAEIIALGGHPSAPEPGVQHRGEAENRISGHLCGSINPTEADITPPSEIGKCHVGIERGPDDPPPRSTRIIEERVVPKPPAAPAYDYNANQDWKNWIEPDGSIRTTPRGPGRYWGPV